MAVPRPLLLALIGVLLLGATFTATRNARDRSDSDSHASSAQAAPKAPAPAKPRVTTAAPDKHRATRSEHAGAKAAPAERAHHARTPAKRRATAIDRQADVARAIGRGRTVVLFFFQPHASDDVATAAAVHALRGTRNVAVFTDQIKHVGRYGPLVGGVGISQAPATVIVDSRRHARLVEGYVDAKTLAQEVADAR